MKLRFLAGIAAGYVLGTRAGRERYEQIKQSLSGLAESDVVTSFKSEVAKRTGSGTSGVATTPVIAGPGPDGLTGSPNTDVVLPDLESSRKGSGGDTTASKSAQAGRIDPPAAV